jgi:serine/threonine protein kinase
VFKGINIKKKTPVAIKIEATNSQFLLLKNESMILNYLYTEGIRRIPIVFWYGKYGENLCMVMSLFEKSIYDCAKSNLLTIEKIYQIILQSVRVLENIHQKFVLHRDIKPQNIMLRNGEICFIDFGLSVFYINENREHIQNKQNAEHHITGTPKWLSYNIHNGNTSSRRDDLISLGYIFLFLLERGHLPWSGSQPELIKYKDLKNIKSYTSDEKFLKFMEQCYDLTFNSEPNYYALKDILENNIKE